MNGSNPNSPGGIGCTTSRGHSRCAVRWSLSPHPSPLPWGWSLPTSLLAGHHGFLASMSSVQIRIFQIRNPKQIQNTENPKSKTPIVIQGSLGDSSAFALFRIWDLFRNSRFGFRISLPDRRCPAKKMWDIFSPWGEGEPFSPRSTIQTFRLSRCGASCSLSLPPSSRSGALARREGGRVRVRGTGANYPLPYRTIPGTIELTESSGEAGGFPK